MSTFGTYCIDGDLHISDVSQASIYVNWEHTSVGTCQSLQRPASVSTFCTYCIDADLHISDVSQASIYVNWECASVGVVNRDGTSSDSKGDFAIKLDILIEAGTKTGYLATVKGSIDGEER